MKFAIPFILREKEEEIQTRAIDTEKLESLETFGFEQLKAMIGKGEKFHSLDVQERTRFGDYRVNGGVMTATGYNEGVQYVAEHGGAYWLIDEIAFGQAEPAVAAEKFQVWRLAVNTDHTAILTCDDSNDRVVLTKQIEYTDFQLTEIRFYFTNRSCQYCYHKDL